MTGVAGRTFWALRVAADEDPNGVLKAVRMLMLDGVGAYCPKCGGRFTTHNLGKVYCSDQCRKRASVARVKARTATRAELPADVPEGI